MPDTQTECCPKFDPAPWDGKVLEWQGKKFIKDSVFTLFYMPVNFPAVIKRMMGLIGKAGADSPQWLCLSDHTSRWNMDLYLAVDREVPGATNLELNGKYLAKVYEGPFKDTGKWCADFAAYAKSQNLNPGKLYMWYTTCPKCARKYGKNYVVIFGQID